MRETIDLTPTWGQWGKIFFLFACCGERTRIEGMKPDFAKAMSAAQAFHAVQGSLTPEQTEKAQRTFHAEMAKQGFPQDTLTQMLHELHDEFCDCRRETAS
jgi:hypothetical protein